MGIIHSSTLLQDTLDFEAETPQSSLMWEVERQLFELDRLLALEEEIDLKSAPGRLFRLYVEGARDYRTMIIKRVELVEKLKAETPQNPLMWEVLRATESDLEDGREWIVRMNSLLDEIEHPPSKGEVKDLLERARVQGAELGRLVAAEEFSCFLYDEDSAKMASEEAVQRQSKIETETRDIEEFADDGVSQKGLADLMRQLEDTLLEAKSLQGWFEYVLNNVEL